MMPLTTTTNPPTDNLYKFLFIAGVLLTITGLVVPSYLQQQRLESSYILIKESAERNRSAILQLGTIAMNDPEMKDRQRRVEALQSMSQSVKEMDKSEKNFLAYEFKLRDEIVSKQLHLLDWCIALGIGLILIGGILWYHKTQKYQDRMLIAQTKEIEEKVSNLNTKP